jgi:plasmid stabilization system protein ParE
VSCPLIIRPQAEADLTEAFKWYEERRNGLGFEFLTEARSILRIIGENPLRHPVIYRNVRRALTRKFPYKIFYLFEADKVEVVGVIHAKRHPQIWRQRVS